MTTSVPQTREPAAGVWPHHTLSDPQSATPPKLDLALTYATRGWHVFPVTPNGKTPLGALAPHGHRDATTDHAQIHAWWTHAPDANIGINCTRSGLYVVDIDQGSGKDGQASWDTLTASHGHARTYTVRSQAGGLHLYYRMPPVPRANTADTLGRHIDTRGNGYILAPGSTIDGRTYQVIDDTDIANLPQWITDAVPEDTETAEDPVTRRIHELADELATTPDGRGNDAAASIAYMIGQYVGANQIPETTATNIVLDAIASWTYTTPRDERTMRRTITRQVKEGARHPRAWTETAPKVDTGKRLADIRDAMNATTWTGRSGPRNRVVLVALLKVAARKGTTSPTISVRSLCEQTPIRSHDSIENAVKALEADGWLTRMRDRSMPHQPTAYQLHAPRGRGGTKTGQQYGQGGPCWPPKDPPQTGDVNTDLAMATSLHAARLYAALSPEQGQSKKSLVRTSGVSKQTVDRWLPVLTKRGLARQDAEGRWYRGDTSITTVALEDDVPGKVEKRAERHAKQREAWAGWIEFRGGDIDNLRFRQWHADRDAARARRSHG